MISKSVVKYIQSLQHKKFRDEHLVFVAEGVKVVNELLSGNHFICEHVWCTRKADELLPKQPEGKLTVIEDFEMEKISGQTTAAGVLAVFHQKKTDEKFDITGGVSLVLDGIQDPGNLGTIIRTADWFGVKNIICSPSTADCYNPKVVQSTMASLGRVNIVYRELQEWMAGITVKKYAAVLGGENIHNTTKIKEGIIIIGNESKGISKELINLADEKITIPKTGEAESLNAAVAAGIILFSLV